MVHKLALGQMHQTCVPLSLESNHIATEALTETLLLDLDSQSPSLGPELDQAKERIQDRSWYESFSLTTKNHNSIMNGKDPGMLAYGIQFDILCLYDILCFFSLFLKNNKSNYKN